MWRLKMVISISLYSIFGGVALASILLHGLNAFNAVCGLVSVILILYIAKSIDEKDNIHERF